MRSPTVPDTIQSILQSSNPKNPSSDNVHHQSLHFLPALLSPALFLELVGVQQSLFDSRSERRSQMAKLLQAVDKINKQQGRETVRFAAAGFEQKWTMRQAYRSKHYTTKLADVMLVKAK